MCFRSHEVLNKNTSVVAVSVGLEATITLGKTFSEWVCDHAVAGLEANLGLEGVRVDCTNHAGEERKGSRTDLRHKEKYPYNLQRRSACHCHLRLQSKDQRRLLMLTVQGANQGVTELSSGTRPFRLPVESRSVVEYTCHGREQKQHQQNRSGCCPSRDEFFDDRLR